MTDQHTSTACRSLARHFRECVDDDEGNWARVNIDALLDAAEFLERFAALAQTEPQGSVEHQRP